MSQSARGSRAGRLNDMLAHLFSLGGRQLAVPIDDLCICLDTRSDTLLGSRKRKHNLRTPCVPMFKCTLQALPRVTLLADL
jgi:hypothetical protein